MAIERFYSRTLFILTPEIVRNFGISVGLLANGGKIRGISPAAIKHDVNWFIVER